MKQLRISLLLLACALSVTAMAQGTGYDPNSQIEGGPNHSSTSKKPNLSSAEQHFINNAASGGLAEVQLGQLAAQKASDSQVKAFGQRMVDDHTKANNELTSLASSKGMTPPTSPKATDQAMKDKLSGLSGQQFDKQYMDAMVTDHTHDVSEFQKMANGAKDPELKAFAAKTLPTLQDHLKQAQDVQKKLGGK